MGKRKKAAKPPPKQKSAKLDTVFDCLYCGHEQTCDVFIDKMKMLGTIQCRTCGADHTTKVNMLEEAVDVYASWIDAAQSHEEPAASAANARKEAAPTPASKRMAVVVSDDEEEDAASLRGRDEVEQDDEEDEED